MLAILIESTYVGIAMVVVMGDVGSWDDRGCGNSEDGKADE